MTHAVTPRRFLDDEFMLESGVARELYHEFAAPLPILDFHSHLSPQQLAADHRFRSITEIWLDGDHYKWRAMRADGVAEHLITGGACDWERFEAWARTVPATLRNPLYHWTHLELRRAFGICFFNARDYFGFTRSRSQAAPLNKSVAAA
jgi:glucuronate isomerase